MYMLTSGLGQIPGFCFTFMCYLWHTLVAPVALYGCELFIFGQDVTNNFNSAEIQCWRRLLLVGGRAPFDAVYSVRGFGPVSMEFDVRRVAFFVRLANSPTCSWQHAALTYHCMINSD
eukprot:3454506-Karenia_brevis.AAC.1